MRKTSRIIRTFVAIVAFFVFAWCGSATAQTTEQFAAWECLERATSIAEEVDAAGRHVRQIELCEPHLDFVIRAQARSRLGSSGPANGELGFMVFGRWPLTRA